MAKQTRTNNGGTITFDQDDWTGGLSMGADFTNGIPILKYPTNQNRTLTGIDPYRNYGFIQPGVYPSSATNSSALSGPLVAGVIYSDYTTIYGVDYNGKVQSYNQITNTILNSGGTFPHTIAGTSPIGQDVVIYKHNYGGTDPAHQLYSLFYSYYNNANWDVGAYVNFTSFDDDFMSSIPATPLDITSGDGDDPAQRTSAHTFCVGSDDLLYIGSGRYVHAYDGSQGNNGTFFARVLTLPVGFQVTGMIKYNDTLLIAGNYFPANSGSTFGSGQATVYVWNYIDQDITQVIPLSDASVVSIFIWRGNPCVITNGAPASRGTLRVKALVGNNAVKLTDIGSLQAPVFRGVDSTTQTLYINCGGAILSVGDKLKDTGFELNHLTVCSTGTVSGWINVLPGANNFTILASASENGFTSPKIEKFDNSAIGYTTGTYRSNFVEPAFPLGRIGRVKNVNVFFNNPVTSTDPFVILLVTDFNQVANTIVASQTSLTLPLTKQYFTDSSGNPLPEFSNVSLYMVWQNGQPTYVDTFVVSKVVLEYEDVDLPSNTVVS